MNHKIAFITLASILMLCNAIKAEEPKSQIYKNVFRFMYSEYKDIFRMYSKYKDVFEFMNSDREDIKWDKKYDEFPIEELFGVENLLGSRYTYDFTEENITEDETDFYIRRLTCRGESEGDGYILIKNDNKYEIFKENDRSLIFSSFYRGFLKNGDSFSSVELMRAIYEISRSRGITITPRNDERINHLVYLDSNEDKKIGIGERTRPYKIIYTNNKQGTVSSLLMDSVTNDIYSFMNKKVPCDDLTLKEDTLVSKVKIENLCTGEKGIVTPLFLKSMGLFGLYLISSDCDKNKRKFVISKKNNQFEIYRAEDINIILSLNNFEELLSFIPGNNLRRCLDRLYELSKDSVDGRTVKKYGNLEFISNP